MLIFKPFGFQIRKNKIGNGLKVTNPKEQKKKTQKKSRMHAYGSNINNYLLPNLCPFGFWNVHCIAFLDSECLVEVINTDELSVYSPFAK